MIRLDRTIDYEDIERRYSDARARRDDLTQLIKQMESNVSKRLWLSCAAFFAMGVVFGAGITN